MASAVIGALRVVLSADSAEFKRSLNDAERAVEKFGRTIGSGLKTGVLALGAAAAAGAAALVALTKSSFDTISAQVDLSKRVGASVAAIQTLQHATELAGGNAEAMAKALGTLNARLGEAAREGAGPAFEAIERLGLSISELSAMDADEKIKAISERMKELNFSTEQQADTIRQLGIRNQEIINLFQEGSEAIDQARSDLQAWGVLLSDVDAGKVEAAGDAWEKIGTVLQGVGNQIAIRVAPLLTAIADGVSDAAKETGGFGSVIDRVINAAVRLWGALNREIYDFRITVDSAIGALLDGFNAVAGFPPGIIAKIFGGTAEDYGFKPIIHSYGNLVNTLRKPPTDEEWIAWLDGIRQKSDEAAAAIQRTMGTGTGEDGIEGPTVDQKRLKLIEEQEQYQEFLNQKMASLNEALMTEAETERAQYEQRLTDLENFHNLGMMSDQQYIDALTRNKEQYAERMKDIEEEITRDQIRNFQQQADSWFDIASTIGDALEGLFGESKAIAVAQAIINTAQAITRTLAEYGATPLGWAAAAAAAAAGAAQIATIMRTQKSSKSGGGSVSRPSSGGSASSSPQSSSAPAAGNNQTLFINGLNPAALYSGEAVRALATALIDFQRDGGKIVLGNA